MHGPLAARGPCKHGVEVVGGCCLCNAWPGDLWPTWYGPCGMGPLLLQPGGHVAPRHLKVGQPCSISITNTILYFFLLNMSFSQSPIVLSRKMKVIELQLAPPSGQSIEFREYLTEDCALSKMSQYK